MKAMKKIKILGLLCGFLYTEFFPNIVHCTKWIDDLTRYIAEDSGCHQIHLMTGQTIIFESPLTNELSIKLMENIPTRRINFAENPESPTDNTMSDDVIVEISSFDTTATLFLLVDETDEGLPSSTSRRFIDLAAEMSSYHYSSKYLVVSVARHSTESFDDLLHRAWSKKLLDFTIIEIINEKTSFGSSSKPIVHRINPFEKTYTRTNWTSDIERLLFPKKTLNMRGHPLRVGAAEIPPFTIARFDDHGEPVNISGTNFIVMNIIAEKLNLSMKYVPLMYDESIIEKNKSDSVNQMYNRLANLEIDIEAFLSPNFDLTRNNTLRTTVVLADKYCAVVPVLPKTKFPLSTSFLKAYLLSFCIVSVFWIIKRSFRFECSIWKPHNIFRVFFTGTLYERPNTDAQRIIFVSLFVTSAFYSSAIYASITNANLLLKTEMKFETLDDLDDSGLIPMVNSFVFNKTFDKSTGALLRLKKKTIATVDDRFDCELYTAKHKNVTCGSLKRSAIPAIEKINRQGHVILKIADACFWSDGLAFMIGKRLPFRPEIDNIIMKLQDTGVIGKLYDSKRIAPSRHAVMIYRSLRWKRIMIHLRQQLLAIVIIGWALSLLLFFGEILVFFLTKSP